MRRVTVWRGRMWVTSSGRDASAPGTGEHQIHLPWRRSCSRGVAAKHQELRAVGRHVVLITHIVNLEQDGRASKGQLLARARRDGDHLAPAPIDDLPLAGPPGRR